MGDERPRTPWLMLLGGVAFWVVVGLLDTTQVVVLYQRVGRPTAWLDVARFNLPFYVLAGLLTPLVALAYRWFPLTGRNLLRNAWPHVGFCLVFAVVHSWLFAVVRVATNSKMLWSDLSAVWFKGMTGNLDREILIYVLGVAALAAWDFQRGLRAQERARAALEVERERLRADLADAQLESLKMQLQPHFLFNALHATSTLIKRGDQDAAHAMLLELSDFLRLCLDNAEAAEVPLSVECDFLTAYLKVQQARFGERLQARCEIDPDVRDARVPNLVLQPLVENALQHGLAPRGGGTLTVRAGREGGRLVIAIADDGQGPPPPPRLREGRGLRNVRQRLAHLYPGDFTFTLEARPEGGALVRLDLPLRPVPAPVGGNHETDPNADRR